MPLLSVKIHSFVLRILLMEGEMEKVGQCVPLGLARLGLQYFKPDWCRARGRVKSRAPCSKIIKNFDSGGRALN